MDIVELLKKEESLERHWAGGLRMDEFLGILIAALPLYFDGGHFAEESILCMANSAMCLIKISYHRVIGFVLSGYFIRQIEVGEKCFFIFVFFLPIILHSSDSSGGGGLYHTQKH